MAKSFAMSDNIPYWSRYDTCVNQLFVWDCTGSQPLRVRLDFMKQARGFVAENGHRARSKEEALVLMSDYV
jgi:hypothetical protein